jgi:hypothetical protein
MEQFSNKQFLKPRPQQGQRAENKPRPQQGQRAENKPRPHQGNGHGHGHGNRYRGGSYDGFEYGLFYYSDYIPIRDRIYTIPVVDNSPIIINTVVPDTIIVPLVQPNVSSHTQPNVITPASPEPTYSALTSDANVIVTHSTDQNLEKNKNVVSQTSDNNTNIMIVFILLLILLFFFSQKK